MLLPLARSAWPHLTAQHQPSFRLIPAQAEQPSCVVEALCEPSVSVAVLQRSRPQETQSWPEVVDISSRLLLSVAASDEHEQLDEMLAETFVCASRASRAEMARLIRLFAHVAREAGGATSPETWLNCRLMVTDGARKCPRLHYDKVACRLTVALRGEGTRWLEDGAINRRGLATMLRPELLPRWLQEMLLQPWGWYLYNSLVRVPLTSEQRTPEGDAVFMKGSRWRLGLPRATASGRRNRRALPAMHRSPLERELMHGSGSRRALFTVDFS